ncbi:MAG: hypothetical protein JO353_12445, partial [Phycisphaerae bacterium]|nr:hypothetical protein [Phycisphaerae bacterium]
MRRRDISWTVALCASMTAHALFIRWRADRYAADYSSIYLPGIPSAALTMAQQQSVEEVDRLGDSKGMGTAVDYSPGDVELRAPKSDQEQSFLSRDPQGPGQIGTPPSQSQQTPGENGENGNRATEVALLEPASPQQAFGIQSGTAPSPTFPSAKVPQQVKPDQAQSPGPTRVPQTQPVVLAQMMPKGVQTATPSKPQPPQPQIASSANVAHPGRPGPNAPAADPAPQADTESDPFTRV